MPETAARIGVEIGGTFTDLVALETGISVAKVPSVRERPEEGALAAIDSAGIDLSKVAEIVHGSTVATNAVLERRGGQIAFVTTRGFEDILFLQRHARRRIYDLFYQKPTPIVRRRNVLGLDERVIGDGTIDVALEEAATEAALVEHISGRGMDGVAVCLLNAYVNPSHEQMVRRILQRRFPKLPVTISSEISGEFREYERASTTTLAAYVQPVVAAYLRRFESELKARGFAGRLSVMQSNGGSAPVAAMDRNAVNALLSGPAAGVVGAVRQVERSGFKKIMTLDIGGTSADVCLVADGKPALARQSTIDGLPVQTPMVDVNTIGAGGGSIVSVDEGGMLHVGPRSAGADPGPACYGRGGQVPTLTDAHVIRGAIRADARLAGDMALDVDASRKAMEPIAQALGKPVEEAAEIAIRVANANIAGALRIVSTEQGRDPRDYALVAYGGAGPLHAAEIAENLGMRTVIIPPSAGVLSAFGLLVSDKTHFETLTRNIRLDDGASAAVQEVAGQMRTLVEDHFHGLGVAGEPEWDLVLDMRLVGQAFEIPVPIGGVSGAVTLEELRDAFQAAHEKAYSYRSSGGKPIEIVSLRLGGRIRSDDLSATFGADAAALSGAPQERPITIAGQTVAGQFVPRASIRVGDAIAGPAVVEDPTSTTFVPPDWIASVDAAENLLVRRMQ